MKPKFYLIITSLLIVLITTGCDMNGISKEERIILFKATILAGENARIHFEGRSTAANVVETTFESPFWTPTDNISFPGGNSITGNTFNFQFEHDNTVGEETAIGEFYEVVKPDGTSDWYLLYIDIPGFGEIPTDPDAS